MPYVPQCSFSLAFGTLMDTHGFGISSRDFSVVREIFWVLYFQGFVKDVVGRDFGGG
jgi:hypothetical protein